MAILASLPGLNLFSSFPSKRPLNDPSSTSKPPPAPPIPIPKYPPKQPKPKPQPQPQPQPQPSSASNPRRQYPEPVSDGVISSDGDRSVVVGESGVSYLVPGAPFEFQFSYSETPNVKPLAIREPAFLPFAPPTMPRPWTGKAPLKKKMDKKKNKIRLYEPLNPPPAPAAGEEGPRHLLMQRAVRLGTFPGNERTREEILGEPLTREEINGLLRPHLHDNRQVNLGRDGLTHNMLELIHTHWKRRPVCKVRCKGVPTVDMDNICRCLEEKSGGKIIFRAGGAVYLFRGRNYDPHNRPRYPLMLWKPAVPVYPKLIQEAPEGLTKDEADELRMKGKKLLPLYRLAKNGVYLSIVKDVRNAFEESPLVKIDCKGMEPTDYKKLGAKLKELVPCVLLSFDDEQILAWRGQGWKSMYRAPASISASSDASLLNVSANPSSDGELDAKALSLSSKLASLWKQAIASSNALLLDEINLGPDNLLKKVEEFESICKDSQHSCATAIPSGQDPYNTVTAPYEDCPLDVDDQDGFSSDDETYESDSFEESESAIPYGSLPVDAIAEQLGGQCKLERGLD